MRVYIAAPWKHREEARNVMALLMKAGHTVIARWLTDPDHIDTTDHTNLQHQALCDLEDIDNSQVLVLLNLAASEGKATEFGYTWGQGKPIIVVGTADAQHRNIFYHLPEVQYVNDLDEVLVLLQ